MDKNLHSAIRCFRNHLLSKCKKSFTGKDLVTFILGSPSLWTAKKRSVITTLVNSTLADPTRPQVCIIAYKNSNKAFEDTSAKYTFLDFFIEISNEKHNILNSHLFNNLFNNDLPVYYLPEHDHHAILKDTGVFINKLSAVMKELARTGLERTSCKISPVIFNDRNQQTHRYYQLINYLPFVNIEPLMTNNEVRQVFFVNLYNHMSVHVSTFCYEKKRGLGFPDNKCAKNRRRRFYYNIGGCIYSLDDIKKEILGCNPIKRSSLTELACGLTSIFKSTKTSTTNSKDTLRNRLKSNVNTDPRIYLALFENRAISDPIPIFTVSDFDSELDRIVNDFTLKCQIAVDQQVLTCYIPFIIEKEFGAQPLKLVSIILEHIDGAFKSYVSKVLTKQMRFRVHWFN